MKKFKFYILKHGRNGNVVRSQERIVESVDAEEAQEFANTFVSHRTFGGFYETVSRVEEVEG